MFGIRTAIKKLLSSNPEPAHLTRVEDGVELDGCTLIGDNEVGMDSYANDSLLRNLSIGRFCSIGRRCSLGAARHSIDSFSTHSQFAPSDFIAGPRTIIGNDVWIGDNVVIVSGLTIGDGAVVGGGAVVTRDVAPYEIVAGVPARILRLRFEKAIATALLESAWWRYGRAVASLAGPDRDPRVLVDALSRHSLPITPPHFKPWVAR